MQFLTIRDQPKNCRNLIFNLNVRKKTFEIKGFFEFTTFYRYLCNKNETKTWTTVGAFYECCHHLKKLKSKKKLKELSKTRLQKSAILRWITQCTTQAGETYKIIPPRTSINVVLLCHYHSLSPDEPAIWFKANKALDFAHNRSYNGIYCEWVPRLDKSQVFTVFYWHNRDESNFKWIIKHF